MINYQPFPTEAISIVPPRDAQAEPRTSLDRLRARFVRNDGLPFADVLTEPRIRDALDEHGVRYRDRVFNPVTTLWGFLSQVLSDDHSCRDAVTRIIAHRAASGLETCSPNTASYCNARGRLPTGVLRTLARRTAQELQAATARGVEVERAGRLHRRRVARLHARHAGEPGGLPAAADAAAGDRLPAGPGRRAAVAGDRRLPRPGHRPVRGQGDRRDHPAAGDVRLASGPATWSWPTPCSTTTSWSASCATAGSIWSPASSTSAWGARRCEGRPDGDILLWRRPNKPHGMTGEQYRRYPKSPADAPGDRRCPRQGQPRRAVPGRHHDPRRVDRRRADRRPVRAEVGGGSRHPFDQVDDADGRPAVQDAGDGAQGDLGPPAGVQPAPHGDGRGRRPRTASSRGR